MQTIGNKKKKSPIGRRSMAIWRKVYLFFKLQVLLVQQQLFFELCNAELKEEHYVCSLLFPNMQIE